jgi:hypothetical protein
MLNINTYHTYGQLLNLYIKNGDWCEFEAIITFCGMDNADILLLAASSSMIVQQWQQNTVLARLPHFQLGQWA